MPYSYSALVVASTSAVFSKQQRADWFISSNLTKILASHTAASWSSRIVGLNGHYLRLRLIRQTSRFFSSRRGKWNTFSLWLLFSLKLKKTVIFSPFYQPFQLSSLLLVQPQRMAS